MFLLLCQSRLAKICLSATLVLLEMRQASYKSCLQERPCFFPNSTLHARHACVLFGPCGNFSRYPHPHLMITKVAAWQQLLSTSASSQRQGKGLCFRPSLGGSSDSALSLSSSRLCSQTCHQSSSDAVRLMRGHKSFTWRGILSTNDCRLIIFVTRP